MMRELFVITVKLWYCIRLCIVDVDDWRICLVGDKMEELRKIIELPREMSSRSKRK